MTHAVTASVAETKAILRRREAMEWILLEAGVALLLAVFIVWFTTGGKRKRDPTAGETATDAKPDPDRKR